MQKEDFKKSIYVLPNLFTSMNLFCGFYAIVSAVDSRFVDASVAILIAGIFDLLDGKIARATKTTSQFGVEYDSLSDLVSFGLAPALLMYLWALKPLGRLGWLAGFLFMICGALRLARFNTMAATSTGASSYFQGLPIPAAAGLNVAAILFFSRFNIDPHFYRFVLLVMLYLTSFLMVSSVKYNSFKNAGLFKSMKFNRLVALVLILVALAYEPYIFLFVGTLAYVVSGPALFFFSMSHRREDEETEIC
ncbi:MAG: CDP-diacylglycerol--serine O-phosphatidyltransferase [Desulfobacterium sp.]|nr:CDP-diacylglycerol--serine O-phosphatidyltransferase [Desulfobacterium sp.]